MTASSDIQEVDEAYLEKSYLTDDKEISTGIDEVIITISASDCKRRGNLSNTIIIQKNIGKIKEQLGAGAYSVNGKLVAKSIITLFG